MKSIIIGGVLILLGIAVTVLGFEQSKLKEHREKRNEILMHCWRTLADAHNTKNALDAKHMSERLGRFIEGYTNTTEPVNAPYDVFTSVCTDILTAVLAEWQDIDSTLSNIQSDRMIDVTSVDDATEIEWRLASIDKARSMLKSGDQHKGNVLARIGEIVSNSNLNDEDRYIYFQQAKHYVSQISFVSSDEFSKMDFRIWLKRREELYRYLYDKKDSYKIVNGQILFNNNIDLVVFEEKLREEEYAKQRFISN